MRPRESKNAKAPETLETIWPEWRDIDARRATGREIGKSRKPIVVAGDAPEPADRGEVLFRKCSVCHAVTPDGERRAGPNLYGLFGRKVGTVPGYKYSEALRNSDFVWTAETVSRLFELGPDEATPGSKMPLQRMPNPDDRAALIAYLRRVTRAE